MAHEYVEQRNGGYCVAGTCVSLDSLVYSFKKRRLAGNHSPELPIPHPRTSVRFNRFLPGS